MNHLKVAAIGVLSFGIAFLFTDCIMGETQYQEEKVIDKEFKAAYNEVSTSTDSDGNLHVSTIHHPEEYLFLLENLGWTKTTAGVYGETSIGDMVTATYRKGKFTSIKWLSRAMK